MNGETTTILNSFMDQYGLSEKMRGPFKVLDVGSRDVNGASRNTFVEKGELVEYTGVDLVAGQNVDIVLETPYVYPFPDETFDLAVSTHTFEHVEFPWESLAEMARVVKTNGNIIIIHPCMGFQIHRFPIDCWRFLPDSYIALAKWANITLIDLRLEPDYAGSLMTCGFFTKVESEVNYDVLMKTFYDKIRGAGTPVENPP